jgi:hypothetical protein
MTRVAPHVLVLIAAMISGCQHGLSPDLKSLVDHQVHLEGRLGGPGKLADYVSVPGGQVYLFAPIDSAGEKLDYGSMVAVEGVLGYRSYPPSTQAADEPIVARPPDHYFIDKPRVRVLRPRGGES